MSLWWSFTLTAFGAAGIFLTYRSYTAYLGPAIGISIQLVWVAYAIASQQWWFIVSALLYGGSHLYGIRKRQREREEVALSAAVSEGLEARRFMKAAASVRSWMAPRPYSGPGIDSLPGVAPPTVVVQDQERPLEPGETESQRWGDFDF